MMIDFPSCEQEITWYLSEKHEVIEFEEGLSNSTYLVVHEGRKYVVRDFHLKQNTSEQFRELWMMQLAAELGVAPKIIHVDLKKGYAVIDYIEGEHPEASSNKLKQAVHQLRKVHDMVNYEPFASIYDSLQNIDLEDMSRLNHAISIIREIEKVIKTAGSTCCHLDFHTKNIIEGDDGKTWIIDWESTGLAHPFYDVAKLAHSLSFKDALELLGEYLQRAPTPTEEAQFYLLRSVVYMSIATNRYSKGEVDTARKALDDFLEIASVQHFQECLKMCQPS